jgi:uncharacterized protein YjbJ (UPF0337 family)
MISQQQLEEHWDELKACLQKRWGHLTDDELQQTRGDRTLLLGALERRTGLSQREIEEFIDQAAGGAQTIVQRAADAVGQYAGQAAESVRKQYGQAVEGVRGGYGYAEQAVRRRPAESAAIAFGAGVVTGLVIGMVFAQRGR